MSEHHKGRFMQANGLQQHYLQYGEEGPQILLLHSLSANAQIFQGLIARGLSRSFKVIIPDLRGRGYSDRSRDDYCLETESSDLVALLDQLQIDQIIVCGHSFGGLLAVYFAAHYPQRVSRLIILDAAVQLNPLTPFLISYATGRLLRCYTSWDEYVALVQKAPFMDLWDASILPFLREDMVVAETGMVRPRSSWIDITMAAKEIARISACEWRKYFSSVRQPMLLIKAGAPFMHGQFIVEDENAIQSAVLALQGDLIEVPGNHITMLFGDGAAEIVKALKELCLVNKKKRTLTAETA